MFDNGVDYVTDPEGLGGEWFAQWERTLRALAQLADAVTVVRVEAVRLDVSPEGRRLVRLLCTPEQMLWGRLPEDQKEGLTLTVSERQDAFGTVEGRDDALLGRRFVAFLRYVPGDQGNVTIRWHLAAAGGAVLRRTQAWLQEREERRRRTSRYEARHGESAP